MKFLLTVTVLLALGTIAVHGAVVVILLAVAGFGGFAIGATGRNLWRGGQ